MADAATLFPASATQGADASLLKFKAGKMTHTRVPGENKYKVVAHAKKGFIFMERDISGLMHLKWRERDSATVLPGDDHVVISGDQTFSRVDTGVAADRVYLLQYKNSDRRFFYWMQEPKEEKDAAHVKKLQELIGQTIADNATGAGSTAAALAAPSDLQSILAAMQAGVAEAEADGEQAVDGVDNSALLAAMQAAMQSAPFGGGAAGGAQQPQERPTIVPLTAIARHPDVASALATEEAKSELVPLLPEGLQTEAELASTTTRPQFQQALNRVTQALQSSSINTVMANFNLDPSAGQAHLARGDGVAAFVAAVQAQADSAMGEGDAEAMEEAEDDEAIED
jgi:hypothetical protein